MAGSLIYEGRSLLGGGYIFVAAIRSSRNAKTGNMVQTYIMCQHPDPLTASKLGIDFDICGNCRHRGSATTAPARKIAKDRTCYVNLAQGALQVYKAYRRGAYEYEAPESVGRGKYVRVGTYGDPAAVPASVWRALLSNSAGHTAYSHQFETAGADFDASIFMRSVDSRAEAYAAAAAGQRSFRVINQADYSAGRDAPIAGLEVSCPASAEAGRRTTCVDCLLCSGAQLRAKSVAIVAHGAAGGKV